MTYFSKLGFVVFLAALFSVSLVSAEETKTYSTLDSKLPPWMLDVLKDEGYTAATGDAGILFLGGRLDKADKAQKIIDAIRKGTTIVYSVDTPTTIEKSLAALLPINDWTIKDPRLVRENVLVMPILPKDGTFSVAKAFDLHLPGGAMENSQNRYLYPDYEKSLNNSDWGIFATTPNGMPIMLSGRTGNAKIVVFGAAWSDVDSSNPNARKLCADLLLYAQSRLDPYGVELNRELSENVKIEVPRYQYPSEGLYVSIENPEPKPVQIVLAYQVANWEREILSADTMNLTLKPNERDRFMIRERDLFKGFGVGEDTITETGSSLPYRRIRVGLLTTGRKSVVNESRHNVLAAPPIEMSLIENSERWVKEPFHEEIDGGDDGNIAKRFVWTTGSSPQLTVRISNRLANIAPLATAKDLTDPENPTIEGLNDLSLSQSDARREGLWNGSWIGKALPAHRLSLQWSDDVVVAGIGVESFGPYRFEENALPKNLLLKSNNQTVWQKDEPEFTANGSTMFRRFSAKFAPQTLNSLDLEITKFGEKLGNINHKSTNAAIKELQLFGWVNPDESGVRSGLVRPETVSGELEITATDLVSGKTAVLKKERIEIPAYSAIEQTLDLPARNEPGPVRYDFVYRIGKTVVASQQYDLFYIPEGQKGITNKKSLADYATSLLCTPGWVQNDNFGLGMVNWTQGWGGAHDKIWAMSLGLMETDYRRLDQPERMFTSNIGSTHYTNPWRYMPDGTFGWDKAIDGIIKTAVEQKKKSIWLTGSDRWNGVPIGHSFGWDQFVRFDKYLRETTGNGLKGYGRKEVIDEIRKDYADRWQVWQLEEYSKKIEETRKRFAEHGIDFHFETHGSFPFAGGELGDRLAETHQGVGTDLFWELRNQDLYWSLGTRFAIVAANPNLISGMYKQWGWINSESNMFWFANNGPVEPARRQWYSSYFMGRVDSKGTFQPYHTLGFSMQGNVSTKFYPHEIEKATRTFDFTKSVRPEEPAGYGLIVSWDSHLRRMTPEAGTMGFGLYATGGPENQLEYRFAKLYEKLTKSGMPIGFVSSSHALKNWKGKNPLVLLDASDWQGEELKTVTRLNASGVPIVGFGGDDQTAETLKFWTDNSKKVSAGKIEYFVRQSGTSAPLIYCPMNVKTMPAGDALQLVDAVMKHCRLSFYSEPRLAVSPFINGDALFLGLGSLADMNSEAVIRLRPEEFAPQLKGKEFSVIDVDSFEVIAPDASGNLNVPFRAADGKMLMIVEKRE